MAQRIRDKASRLSTLLRFVVARTVSGLVVTVVHLEYASNEAPALKIHKHGWPLAATNVSETRKTPEALEDNPASQSPIAEMVGGRQPGSCT